MFITEQTRHLSPRPRMERRRHAERMVRIYRAYSYLAALLLPAAGIVAAGYYLAAWWLA